MQAHQVAETAQDYSGDFGPQVLTMGEEARAVLTNRAEEVEALSADLRARVDAFEQADRESHDALVAMNREGYYSLGQIWANQTPTDPPWWPIELIIGMVAFGDSIDII